jgi:hypothetical protein
MAKLARAPSKTAAARALPVALGLETARPRWASVLGLGLGLGLGLVSSSGCVVNEAESPTRGVIVSGPPPAPVREDRPPAPSTPPSTPPSAPPSTASVWVSGYWHWTGIQYAWIPGHWEAPPPGATWNAPVYSVRDGKYMYESGVWKPGESRNALR